LSEETIEQKLDKIMDSSSTRSKIFAMSQKQDVSYDVAEIMFRGTMKQMLEDKNTDWSKFEVSKD
jgi:hypothetical protein